MSWDPLFFIQYQPNFSFVRYINDKEEYFKLLIC